ncbi:MAG TPA: hypothetical protein PK887_01620 [Ignavibacteriales bacterium]|nr:hypothetical protein [Ignavibacteriales bacterium]
MSNNITHNDLLNELNSLRKETFEFLKQQANQAELKVIRTSNSNVEISLSQVNLDNFKLEIFKLFSNNVNLKENFSELTILLNSLLKNYFDVFAVILPNEFISSPLTITNLTQSHDVETTISIISTYNKYIFDFFQQGTDIQNNVTEILNNRKINNFNIFPFFFSDNKLFGFLLLETTHKISLADNLIKVLNDISKFIANHFEVHLKSFKNEKIVSLLNKTPTIVVTLSYPDFTVNNISDNIYSYGFFKFEIIGNCWLNYIYYEDRDNFSEKIQEAISSGENSVNLIYRLNTSINTFEWVNHNFLISKNEFDDNYTIDGIIQNISKLKDYEISLENSNSQLTLYTNLLNDLNTINNKKHVSFYHTIIDYIQLVKKSFNFSTGILASIENSTYKIYAIDSSEFNFEANTDFEITETLCEFTIKNNEFTVFADLNHFPELANHPVYLNFQPKCYAGIPIYVNNSLWGTLSFMDKNNALNTNFVATLKDILNIIGHNISFHLQSKLQNETWEANKNLINNKDLIITALTNSFTNGIILQDNTNKIVNINQVVCDMFDFPLPAKVLNKKDVSLFINHIKPLFNDVEAFENFYNSLLENSNNSFHIELETLDNYSILINVRKIYNNNVLLGTLWEFVKSVSPNNEAPKQQSILPTELLEIWKIDSTNLTVNDLPELKKLLLETFSIFTDLMLDFAENFFMNDYDKASEVAQKIIDFAGNKQLPEIVSEAKKLLELVPTKSFNKISDQYEAVNNSIKKFKELSKFIWFDEEEEANN